MGEAKHISRFAKNLPRVRSLVDVPVHNPQINIKLPIDALLPDFSGPLKDFTTPANVNDSLKNLQTLIFCGMSKQGTPNDWFLFGFPLMQHQQPTTQRRRPRFSPGNYSSVAVESADLIRVPAASGQIITFDCLQDCSTSSWLDAKTAWLEPLFRDPKRCAEVEHVESLLFFLKVGIRCWDLGWVGGCATKPKGDQICLGGVLLLNGGVFKESQTEINQ